MLNKITKYSSVIFYVLTMICPVIYNIIGTDTLDDGTLVEPFFLVIFMYIFLGLGIISTIIYFITLKNDSKDKKKTKKKVKKVK